VVVFTGGSICWWMYAVVVVVFGCDFSVVVFASRCCNWWSWQVVVLGGSAIRSCYLLVVAFGCGGGWCWLCMFVVVFLGRGI